MIFPRFADYPAGQRRAVKRLLCAALLSLLIHALLLDYSAVWLRLRDLSPTGKTAARGIAARLVVAAKMPERPFKSAQRLSHSAQPPALDNNAQRQTRRLLSSPDRPIKPNLPSAVRNAPARATAAQESAPPLELPAQQAASSYSVAEGADAPDADGLRQYRLALARQMRAFKRYPQAAKDSGLSGKAVIQLALAAGQVVAVKAADSSGAKLLDEVALDMVRRAAQQTEIPASLRSGRYVISVAVLFALHDE